MNWLRLIAIFTLVVSFGGGQASLIYDESVDGDLAGFAQPGTPLDFDSGSNTIIGTIGPIEIPRPPGWDRQDRFTFTGGTVTSIILVDYTNPGAFGDFTSSFFAFTDFNTFLSGSDFDATFIGQDLLTLLGPAPLGETIATYALDEQNSRATYELDVTFVPEPTTVPEPSIIALFAAGLFGLGFARRRKQI